MTGEVTLNGRVLPIGGVKQKLLAAQRAGLKTVFIPKRNEPDLDDVPAEVLAELDVRPVADVAEILAYALEPSSRRPQPPDGHLWRPTSGCRLAATGGSAGGAAGLEPARRQRRSGEWVAGARHVAERSPAVHASRASTISSSLRATKFHHMTICSLERHAAEQQELGAALGGERPAHARPVPR